MKKLPAAVGLSAVTLSLILAGCSTKTETKPEAASATTSAAAQSESALAVPDMPTGPHKTIADYVTENKIIETPVKQGDADAPKFDFAKPADWKAAGARKPEWAYGAIIYDKPKDPKDPPFITAIVSKLSGNVDAAKVLEYAPGLLQNLPGYEQDGDVQKSSLSGYDGTVFQGSYLRDNVRRYIAQQTIVIPATDGALFVLQLNADSPMGQEQVIRDAAKAIQAGTKITAP
ncbi:MAG: LpqN/LpqT family lipoprotein [Mycobacterium sp.]